jgi:IclR family transcriptional regulator, acetate operon repressor
MAAMAVPVRRADTDAVIGCLSIAAPSVRLDAERMAELAPALQRAAEEIGAASRGSRFFSPAADHPRKADRA